MESPVVPMESDSGKGPSEGGQAPDALKRVSAGLGSAPFATGVASMYREPNPRSQELVFPLCQASCGARDGNFVLLSIGFQNSSHGYKMKREAESLWDVLYHESPVPS